MHKSVFMLLNLFGTRIILSHPFGGNKLSTSLRTWLTVQSYLPNGIKRTILASKPW